MRKIVSDTPHIVTVPVSKADPAKIIIAKTKAGAPVGMVVLIPRIVHFDPPVSRIADLMNGAGPRQRSSAGVIAAIVNSDGKVIAENNDLSDLLTHSLYDFFQLS